MNDPHPSDDSALSRRRALLSDLADGQCRDVDVDEAMRAWKADGRMRQDWQLYQLIGDALRSDDLARGVQVDDVFMRRLRDRLAQEPVRLAPAPLPRPTRRPRRWLSSVAALAGVAVVGASVVVLRTQDGGGWELARTPVAEPSTELRAVGTLPQPAASQALVVDGQVIRDARLDAYFEAHRGAFGPQPSALPGGALRSVEILVPQR